MRRSINIVSKPDPFSIQSHQTQSKMASSQTAAQQDWSYAAMWLQCHHSPDGLMIKVLGIFKGGSAVGAVGGCLVCKWSCSSADPLVSCFQTTSALEILKAVIVK